MTVTKPEHTTEEINDMLFRDALSKNWTLVRLWNRDYCNEVRTSLSGSSADRISNVKKACELLDGLVLIPGQTLSFNDTLGERTEANGWKPATAYANGEVRQEYGGGICQVSSTLYNAVLYANLEIVERACHQFQVGYLPWGMDATVSWGWPDFKFRNDAEYPVKIHAWVDEETNECCVQILGTDVKHQYVLMQFNNWEVFDETGTYFDANGNPLSVGMAAATWRLVFNAGDDYNTATPISKGIRGLQHLQLPHRGHRSPQRPAGLSIKESQERKSYGKTDLLYYNADLLPLREPPHRPRLLHRGERRDRPLQAPVRL